MNNLDVLIGFFLIMLVFASGVSVAQSALKRFLSIKGAAMVGPLLAALEAAWRTQGSPAAHGAAWERLKGRLRRDLTTWRSELAKQLIYASLKDRSDVIAVLRAWGQENLRAAAAPSGDTAAVSNGELATAWEQSIARIEQRWDELAARLTGSYERHTQVYVFLLSMAVVAFFHVDAIRIVRILSVHPEVRGALVELAVRRAQQTPEQRAQHELPGNKTLSQWQGDNVADLRSAGLPLGWETAPLLICGEKAARSAVLESGCGEVPVNRRETFLLWLVRLLGMLISVGLIAQGAPFWYSLLDRALGARAKAVPIAGAILREPDPAAPPA